MLPYEIYYIISLGAIFLLAFIAWMAVLKKVKRELRNVEEKIQQLEEYKSERYESLEARIISLKEMVYARLHKLSNDLNELSKRNDLIMERYGVIGAELDKKIEPLQSLFDVTMSKVDSSNQEMKRAVENGENTIKRMAEGIRIFSDEIRKMKEFIRERTIDLEL
ncbi:MAG: hypothetical protein ACMUIS_04100 [bacterium]